MIKTNSHISLARKIKKGGEGNSRHPSVKAMKIKRQEGEKKRKEKKKKVDTKKVKKDMKLRPWYGDPEK